ncbi:hypothetical protein [Photorhabdus khanii]|uniref:hypothetical protein n=1 Tax=Photorhabdus khanii TaxID=1004150 RepID=UPI0018644495|nr:hypothetical protein [Photorhabdus khanii]
MQIKLFFNHKNEMQITFHPWLCAIKVQIMHRNEAPMMLAQKTIMGLDPYACWW